MNQMLYGDSYDQQLAYAETANVYDIDFPSFSGYEFDSVLDTYNPSYVNRMVPHMAMPEITSTEITKTRSTYENEYRDKYANMLPLYKKLPGFIIDGNPERGLTDTEIVFGEEGLRLYTTYTSPWLGTSELNFQNMFF